MLWSLLGIAALRLLLLVLCLLPLVIGIRLGIFLSGLPPAQWSHADSIPALVGGAATLALPWAFAIKFMFSELACLDHGLGTSESMRRSLQLTRGHWIRFFLLVWTLVLVNAGPALLWAIGLWLSGRSLTLRVAILGYLGLFGYWLCLAGPWSVSILGAAYKSSCDIRDATAAGRRNA